MQGPPGYGPVMVLSKLPTKPKIWNKNEALIFWNGTDLCVIHQRETYTLYVQVHIAIWYIHDRATADTILHFCSFVVLIWKHLSIFKFWWFQTKVQRQCQYCIYQWWLVQLTFSRLHHFQISSSYCFLPEINFTRQTVNSNVRQAGRHNWVISLLPVLFQILFVLPWDHDRCWK